MAEISRVVYVTDFHISVHDVINAVTINRKEVKLLDLMAFTWKRFCMVA